MAILFDLVRRPRTRQTTAAIAQELLTTYQGMEPDIQADYNKELDSRGWKGQKPKIKLNVIVSGNRYVIEVKTDTRNIANRIFRWVDVGTMDEGDPNTTYPIDAVNVDYMTFDVPYQPQTYPPDGQLYYDPSEPVHTVRTAHVDHPGIKPRHFSQAVKARYKDRTYRKGFYRKTENAYRRGFRKAKRMGQL